MNGDRPDLRPRVDEGTAAGASELPLRVIPGAEIRRREMLARLALALAGITTAMVAAPVVGFVVAPMFKPVPRLWRPVGRVEEFKLGETVLVHFEDPSPVPWAGVTARTGAWLRRTGDASFECFAINCRHLGCPVRWVPEAELFMCPCHGGVYYKDGTVAAGPPPEPLHRYRVRVSDGTVEIETAPLPLTIQ
ncbi:MAG TPA: Rieske 2Fe-2S domain-containing protein [Phycisphaerales bacterium]|nr:Rieske 2Fe-2S domain-containing protein [Phycisphaerales bacterium]HMP36637.1 Rieske 2Fe-2S domain-containing protein [Phycisphaerales bacterium]